MSRFLKLVLTVVLPLSLAAAALVSTPLAARPDKPDSGKKVAVLVGINEYTNRKLPNLRYAERDMTELAAVLKAAGFEVRLLLGSAKGKDEATRENIEAALDEVLKGVGKKDTVLLAFSGHGQQFTVKVKGMDKEVPFFCGKDAVPTDAATLVSLSAVLGKLDEKGGGHNLLLVDACRTDPDPNKGTRGGIDGSRVENLGEGTAVFFACSKQQKARETDKAGKGHGVFFHEVLEALKGAPEATNSRGEVTWERLVPYVKERVQNDFPTWFPDLNDDDRQRPHAIGNFVDDPVLIPRLTLPKTFVSAATKMKFVLLPRGKFQMGSPKDEKGHSDDEELHDVEITKPFYLGSCTVTRGQFRKFVDDTGHKTDAETDGKGGYGYDADKGEFNQDPKYTWRNPGFEQTDEHPVVEVSWNDAQAFCAWLSRKESKKYRLPTEAQWEYACRARTQTRFYFGDDAEDLATYGNVADASARKKFPGWSGTIKADDGYVFTAPVGQYKPNGFGLYDMHGNVWQWCADYYDEKYYVNSSIKDPFNSKKPDNDCRVLRGGSWNNNPSTCRAAYRLDNAPEYRLYSIGFRVCLSLD